MSPGEPLRIYDSNLQSQHAAKCDLLLSVDDHRVRYAIIDQLQDQIRLLADRPVENNTAATLSHVFEQDPFLKFRYRKVKVSIFSREFVFIPSEVYAESELDTYSSFIQTSGEVRVTHLRGPRIKNVVAFDKALVSMINKQFTNACFFSQIDPCIDAFTKSYFKPGRSQLFLLFRDDAVEVAYSEGNKLQFYNVLDKRTPDELNYFLLMLVRQFKLRPTQVQVVVAGLIENGDACYERLEKYFTEIIFADSDRIVRRGELFEQVAPQHFFSLLAVNLCE